MEEHVASGGLYKHFKTGGVYFVTGLATEEATGRQVVVYRSLTDGRSWTRALDVFCQKVDGADGSAVLRFDPIAPYFVGARSDEFWPPDAQTVRGALSLGNYRYLQELKKLKELKTKQKWKAAKTRLELEDMLSRYMPVEVDCRLARDITTGSYVAHAQKLSPAENQIMSLEDFIVILLVKLRLDRRGLADIDYDQSLAGVDPGGFVEWLDDMLEEMGYTDKWMHEHLLVGGGISKGKPLPKSYHTVYKGDPFDESRSKPDDKHPGEPS